MTSSVLNTYVNGSTTAKPPVKPSRPVPVSTRDYTNPNINSLKIQFKARGFPDEEILVPLYNKSPYGLHNKSGMFYGLSGTGKTVLINDFMYRMKDMFPKVVVFSPTNQEKHDYDGIVPSPLVYEDFTLENIKELYEHQRAAAQVYNNANNLKVLHGLFKKVATRKSHQYLNRLLNMKNRALMDIEKNYKDPGQRKSKREEVKDMMREKLIAFYKSIIKPHKAKFQGNRNLTDKEALAIKYLDYNPHILVIFDDAMKEIMAMIKEGKKNNDNVLENFFFKGRHAKITHFYAFQDDGGLDPGIRKNAFVNFFTSKNVALHFFNATANNFSPYEKKKAASIIEDVFAHANEKGHPLEHAKLVYMRDNKNPFQYVIADVHDDFRMCSAAVRAYCKKVRRDDSAIDTSNTHMSAFMDGLG